MAKQLQLIHDELLDKQQSAKEIRREYKDLLINSDEYNDLTEEINALREKRAAIEQSIQLGMGRRWEELEETKAEIEEEKEMMTDVAMTNLMDGKTVSVRDKRGDEYEPVWSVKFKKIQ